MKANTLYYGDCLPWMKRWQQDEVIDLIYLDPPFNSNTNYNMLFSAAEGDAQYRAFSDTWYWNEDTQRRYMEVKNAVGYKAHRIIVALHAVLGAYGMLAYLLYMADRLIEMHRLLKPTGSLYLHCDPTASHYLKILLDNIFGAKQFRNEIIWSYENLSATKHYFRKKHDTILFYSKSSVWTFNHEDVRIPYSESSKRRVRHKGSGFAKHVKGSWLHKMGKIPSTVWDIPLLKGGEHLGLPTQKPLKLLTRIIQASSHEGDVVFDPFFGSGTTIEAAHTLKRKWVGIDVSSFAVDLVREKRLRGLHVPVEGMPCDFASAQRLAEDARFDFATWAVMRLPGLLPNTKQHQDGGVNGRGTMQVKADNLNAKLVLAQVEGGTTFSIELLRRFMHVIQEQQAAIGYYLTLMPVPKKSHAHKVVAEMGSMQIGPLVYQRLYLWSVKEYFSGHLPPMPPMMDPYSGKPINRQEGIKYGS